MAFYSNVDETKRAMMLGIQEGLTAAGMELSKQIYDSMDSGYGDPIWLSGDTMRSISANPVNLGDTQVHVGVTTKYAVYVHEGTYCMRPRPFIRDVMQDDLVIQACKDLIQQAISKHLK